MVTFNLETAAGWDALGAAWRAAASNAEAACELRSERERNAKVDTAAIGAPGDCNTHVEAQARLKTIEAIKARHGVPAAEQIQEAMLDVEGALQDEALSHRAPTLAAFMLKLDMLSAPDGWGYNNFDHHTWPIFLADVRRFAMLKSIEKKGARQ